MKLEVGCEFATVLFAFSMIDIRIAVVIRRVGKMVELTRNANSTTQSKVQEMKKALTAKQKK